MLIVFCSHTIPRSDQIEIIKAAQGLKQGDMTMYQSGGYMQMCQNQSGIVVFLYFLSIFFGGNNYIVFQLLFIGACIKSSQAGTDFFKSWKWRDLLFAAVSIAFSVMLKNNSLIFMIAMILYACLKIVGNHKKQILILILTIVLFQWFQGAAVNSFIENKIGQPMESGISPWAYIAMGLQEGDKADGWWNKYNILPIIGNMRLNLWDISLHHNGIIRLL